MDRRLPISPIPNNHRKNLDSLKKPYDVENYQGTKASDQDRKTNRSYHSRRDDDTVGNIKVDLKDNDSVIPYYFENVIKPSVVKDGTLIDVPLIYGGAEIWKTVQRDGYYRDKESKIQVPLIMFKRNTVTKRRDIGNKLDGNQAHLFQVFEKKYSNRDQYDNFNILNNRSPEKEYHAVVVPDYVTLTYDCIIWTEYVENMNKLVEAINFASDTYWGDPNRWKFKATIDSFQNQTEVTVGGNRIVRTTFTLTLNGYLIPSTYNKALANKVKFSSVTNIKFTDEQFTLQNAQTQPQPAVSTFTTTGPGALAGGGTTTSAFPFTGNAVINGSLTVLGSFVDLTGVTAISGSIFSGSFVGDGSGITGVTAEWDGSHFGNASITGSLTVTGGVSGSFSGSYVGDGSQLTGIVASKWSGSNPISRESDVEITGSFKVSGSVTSTDGMLPTGYTYINQKLNSLVTDSSLAATYYGSTSGFSNIRRVSDSTLVIGGVTQNYGFYIFGIKHGLNGSTYTTEFENIIANQVTSSGTLINGDLTVIGTGSFDVLITNYESSSIIYSSGSTKFGDTFDDSHQFTGSMSLTGSNVDFTQATGVSGSFSGSFEGNGSGLTDIPASGIVGLNLSQIASGSATASISPNGGLYVNTNLTASGNISSSKHIGASTISVPGGGQFQLVGSGSNTYIEGGIGYIQTRLDGAQKINISADTFSLLNFKNIDITSTYANITSSGHVSSSAVSTASFGTYLGDGSQLTGINHDSGSWDGQFSGSASITGSLIISGSSKPLEVIGSGSTVFSVVGSEGELFAIDDTLSGSLLVINDISGIPQFEIFSDGRTLIGASPRSLYTTATISATAAATSESIYSLSTSSYDGVFFDYTISSASNARAGNIMSIWNGASLVYTENATSDIGLTSGAVFNVEISQSQAQLISVTDTAGWKIKTTIRSI